MDLPLIDGLAAVLLISGSCLGLGAFVLDRLGLLGALTAPEQAAWSFALGFTGLGLLAPVLHETVGADSPLAAGALVVVALGLICLRKLEGPRAMTGQALPFWLLGLGVLTVLVSLGLDVAEALVPPTEGDTTGYHFELPKRYLLAGEITFLPLALNGAIPQSVHMTYLLALGQGGELGLTLWTMVTGWAAVGLFWAVARTWIGTGPAFLASLVLLTTPALVYAAGSGQVEVRTLLFSLPALLAAARSFQAPSLARAWRWALLSGLFVGGFAGAKFTGLFFVAAVGLLFLVWRPVRLKTVFARCFAFGVGVLATGAGWYVWLYLNTGDPLFPNLYGLLPYAEGAHWSDFTAQGFRDRMALVTGMERSPLNLLFYPVLVMFHSTPAFDSGRTGFGPALAFFLPWIAGGLWVARKSIAKHPLLPVLIIALVYYGVWFYLGGQHKLRHLLVIYPALVLLGAIALDRAFRRLAFQRLAPSAFIAALALTLGFQVAAQGVFTKNSLDHLTSDEGRDTFLARQVQYYTALPLLEGLGANERAVHEMRNIRYFAHPRHYLADNDFQGKIPLSAWGPLDPAGFLETTAEMGITHMIVYGRPDQAGRDFLTQLPRMAAALVEQGCIAPVDRAEVSTLGSRVMAGMGEGKSFDVILYVIDRKACP
ncbi:MAG: ArnT family glycosyltransferase [Magnetovibrionaceae bacterium]